MSYPVGFRKNSATLVGKNFPRTNYLFRHHKDGSVDNIALSHTYNEQQWAWFKAGSALNLIRANNK